MVTPTARTLAVLISLATWATAAPKAGIADKEAEYYRMINIPTPEGVTLEAGALCFLERDKLACSTRLGDIWIADGVLGQDPKPKWTLYASGLHEVLGLAVKPGEKDGWIYCTQRGEVTRMKDSNGDGRADVFETISDAWGIDGDYHEYAFGSKFDKEGNIWVVLCLTGSFSSKNQYRGWCLKVTPEGKTIPVCAGIRSPGGIGFNAAGDVFYTDNQGPWNGSCKLQQLVPGAFVGHPDGLKWFDESPSREMISQAGLKKSATPQDKSRLYTEAKRIPDLLPPSVYYPYPKMGQSAGGFAVDLTGGKFGPFANQLFVGDQTQSIVMRTTLEKVNGHYQGACYPFRSGFDSGCLGAEFAQDGSLFVYGTDRGWGARGGKPFALQRLVWNGKPAFELAEMSARPDGFELTFTEPVDPKTASDPASYKMETYTYIYQASYGSPEVDQTKPAVQSASVSPDGLRVRLKLSEMAEGHVHELHAPGVLSKAGGTPLLHDAAYYTLFYIPKS